MDRLYGFRGDGSSIAQRQKQIPPLRCGMTSKKAKALRLVECLPSHPSQSARRMGHPEMVGWWRRTNKGKATADPYGMTTKKKQQQKSKGSHGGCLYFDAGLDVYAGEGWFSP
jgi:hypothetical protein